MGEETIQGSKLYKGGNYLRKYGIHIPCSHPYIFEIQRLALASVIGQRLNFTIVDCSALADFEKLQLQSGNMI